MPNSNRVLIVYDGTAWFVRGVYLIEHDQSLDFKKYHCDRPISGPHSDPLEAMQSAQEALGQPVTGRRG